MLHDSNSRFNDGPFVQQINGEKGRRLEVDIVSLLIDWGNTEIVVKVVVGDVTNNARALQEKLGLLLFIIRASSSHLSSNNHHHHVATIRAFLPPI